MNSEKLKILFVIINIFLFTVSYGQKHNIDTIQTDVKKNVIYGTLGAIGRGGIIDVNYERLIGESPNKFFTSYLLKVGYGSWGKILGETGTHFVSGVTALTGSRNKHFEFNVGITLLLENHGADQNNPSEPGDRHILPSGAIGYRFQSYNGTAIFRTGIGFPKTLYISLGFCF